MQLIVINHHGHDSSDWPEQLRKFVFHDDNYAKRAFGFLLIEAKRSTSEPGDANCKLQTLNNASHALHNLYESFRRAGKEQVFFDRVRVVLSRNERRWHRGTYSLGG